MFANVVNTKQVCVNNLHTKKMSYYKNEGERVSKSELQSQNQASHSHNSEFRIKFGSF